MATRPRLAQVLQMARALARGSTIDRPRSLLGVVNELRSDTPGDSPLTLRTLMERGDYRDLMTPKVAPGQPAFDFDLPLLDFGQGAGVATGETMRLSSFRQVQPVALIFGSYT